MKLSSVVFTIVAVISIVVLLLFALVGYNTPYEEDPKFVAPKMTDLLLVWMYILTAVTAVLAIISAIMQATKGAKTEKAKGLIGKTGLISAAVLIISLVAGFIAGAADKDTLLINGKAFAAAENKTDFMITDVSLVSIIIMLVFCVLVLIWSMLTQRKS